MPRKTKKPSMELAKSTDPKTVQPQVIAIVPMEEGVYAWILEQPDGGTYNL